MRTIGALLAVLVSVHAVAAEVDVRFCPAGAARSYPLDTVRGVTSLVVQGIALVNVSNAPVRLDTVTIELLRAGTAVDVRTVRAEELKQAAARGKALADSGMMAMLGFQFCDGALLNGSKLAADATLQTNESLILLHQTFAWRGQRDALRVSTAEASATIPIDGTFAQPDIRWPLTGGSWIVAAGASLHTAHRWAVPEQFALDIVKSGPSGYSYRGKGTKVSDFYAYGAQIVAVAAGTVVKVRPARSESAPMLRARGESMEAYFGRVGAAQAQRLALGPAAILGESIVVDQGAGVFAVYAHLQPGSAAVREGEHVAAGQRLGKLGSSGNSTEPHLHFQLCDRPDGLSCAGIPAQFTGIELPLADGPRPLQSGDVVIAQ